MSIRDVDNLSPLPSVEKQAPLSVHELNNDEPELQINGKATSLQALGVSPISSHNNSFKDTPVDTTLQSPPVSMPRDFSVPRSTRESDLMKSIQQSVKHSKSMKKSDSITLYEYRLKFMELQKQDERVELPPEDVALDEYIRLYKLANRMVNGASTLFTWHLYMIVIFFIIEYIATKWVGLDMEGYTMNQINIIDSYNYILKDMGDPGGISPDSNWAPWLKLLFLAAANTIIFFVGKKMFGNAISDKLHVIQNKLIEGMRGVNGSSGISSAGGLWELASAFMGGKEQDIPENTTGPKRRRKE